MPRGTLFTRPLIIRGGGVATQGGDDAFDVTAYGAVGDGVTDDTAAIQAALDTVPTAAVAASLYTTRGARVHLPPGVYRLTATLTLPRGVILTGAGSEATILQYEATTGDVLSYERPDAAMSTQPPITIKGMRIAIKDGVTHTSGAGVHLDSADTTPNRADRCNLEDVYVYATYEGFRIRNMLGGFIRFCEAHSCGSSGFIFRGFCTLLQVSNCWSSANTLHGWDISGWSYCAAMACGSDSNGGSGWLVKKQTGDGTMYGNSFISIGSEGSITSLFTFDTLNATTVLGCLGIAATGATPTVDGVVITACTGLTITPYISTAASATGYPFQITDPTVSTGITLLGGFLGTFAAGANRVTGAENLTIINWQSGGTASFAGQISTTSTNAAGELAVARRTGIAGTAARIAADFRSIATDNAGSVHSRLSADNGSSFAELIANSLVSAPFTYGTFGDAFLRSSGGGTGLVCGANLRFFVNSAGAIRNLATSNGPVGTFTCANNATTTVNNTAVTASSLIYLFPTNAAAATLEGAATKLYISARTAGTSFAVTTGNGAAAAGTETFNYLIVN